MHDPAYAGGYPLDSSGAGGPQLEITAPVSGRPLRNRRITPASISIPFEDWS
jgi:hypothetical protein